MAADATAAYFATIDAIVKVPIAGGALVTLASGQASPTAIAVDEASVYWGNYGTCAGALTDACAGSIMKLTPK